MTIARATGNGWSSTKNTSSASVALAFANNVSAGSLLVAVTSYAENQAPTITDNNGNTWTSALIGLYDGSLMQNIYLSYALNANAGATTVTASGGGTMNRLIAICEYTGAATASAVDGTPVVAVSSGASNPDPGAITTAGAGVLIGAAVVYPTPSPTAGTNYTRQVDDTTGPRYPVVVEDWITSGAQTDNHPNWTTSESFWLALGVGFKEAAGGASVAISSVSDSTLYSGQTGIVITGTGFGASQGSGQVIISPTDNVDDSSAVLQTVTSWGDTSITITAVQKHLAVNVPYYLFVKTDGAVSNDAGFSVMYKFLGPITPRTFARAQAATLSGTGDVTP